MATDKDEKCECCGKRVPGYNTVLLSSGKGHKCICLPYYIILLVTDYECHPDLLY